MGKKISQPSGLLTGLVLAFAVFSMAYGQVISDSVYQLIAPLPNLLLTNGNIAVESVEGWENIRREEVLELFESNVYGRGPQSEISMDYQLKFQDNWALDGSAVMKEVEVSVRKGGKKLDFTILIFLPSAARGAVPVFLGLNFNGNHTIHPCRDISITGNWVPNKPEIGVTENRAIEQSRGGASSRWPVEMILSRGYGVATLYSGDIDPDFDDGFMNGIHGLVQENGGDRSPDSWGTLAAWAWGLSKAMDYLETDPAIDHDRVAVIGHSRLGKAALWAGARDERFAMVVSNNSGCGGAALSRRPFGERLSAINGYFPHWFASKFHEYNDNEAACPVDQHMLLALIAPRPLYVASAVEDEWADPRGEYLSLLTSGDVYRLYGENVLLEEHSPEVNQPRWAGKQGYHIRSGSHGITAYDWEQYLDFADLHLGSHSETLEENPVSMEWIRDHIRSGNPRLILNPELESRVMEKLTSGDSITTMGFRLLEQSAKSMLELEPLSYEKQGRRLLGVSREAVRRITTLAMAYRFNKDPGYLEHLEREIEAVCNFRDWNPDHFLDVAEMATAVALGLDWAGEFLSPEVSALARSALVDKALKPGIAASGNNFWKSVDHNWNLVCNGGLALAALVVFEDEPEIASAILYQAVETIPLALRPYAPDGVYPEGASYWFYATTYLTVAISGFESALGTDFGFSAYPGLRESAIFSMVTAGPSGDYYNFFDASLEGFQDITHFGLLAWFSTHKGEGVDLGAARQLLKEGLSNPRIIRGSRFFGIHLLNLSSMDMNRSAQFSWPETWWGGGLEPVAVLRDRNNDPDAFFFAAKGGMAGDNHGNMDAGSFIFELDGIRWSEDPGNQDYNSLEQIMGNGLWNTEQNSERWTLLTKSNFGHSTLTVNGKQHLVDGRVPLVSSDVRANGAFYTFDLSPLFGDHIQSAFRTFSREGRCLIIRDELVPSGLTESVTWQMITRASVEVKDDRVVLRQDGKELHLVLKTDLPFQARVVGLSPPPLTYDKDIPGLKRIEFNFGREALADSCTILVELREPQP
ncbi:MAG: heparinase II/III family protein [Bacteroidales bacterium]